jgi:SAM-dependent methyltransferase
MNVVKMAHPAVDMSAPARTREPQYEACFAERPVTLGPMTGASWRWNPRRLSMMLSRYKFVAKMFEGFIHVAEIGCADGFGSAVVGQAVGQLDLYDFDAVWRDAVIATTNRIFRVHDIVADGPLPNGGYDGVYMLDVLEHIAPADEPRAMANICASLKPAGVFIAGCPSLESQVYASELSKAHVNCRSGDDFRRDMGRYFRNVFLLGMNDEVLHTGFAPMCHYLFVLCTGPKHET